MVNIAVNKDVLKQMVELGLSFSIIGDKQEKVVPNEWTEKLYDLNKRWNEQKKIGTKHGLPKTRKIIKQHIDVWNKLYWDLYDSKASNIIENSLRLIKIGLLNYINDIKKREDGGYGDHRFTLYEFIKQKNGLQRFLAM